MNIPELRQLIFTSPTLTRSDLFSCLLVSRQWYHYFLPLFWETINTCSLSSISTLPPGKKPRKSICQSILKNAQWIRYLTTDSRVFIKLLIQSEQCKKLIHLELRNEPVDKRPWKRKVYRSFEGDEDERKGGRKAVLTNVSVIVAGLFPLLEMNKEGLKSLVLDNGIQPNRFLEDEYLGQQYQFHFISSRQQNRRRRGQSQSQSQPGANDNSLLQQQQQQQQQQQEQSFDHHHHFLHRAYSEPSLPFHGQNIYTSRHLSIPNWKQPFKDLIQKCRSLQGSFHHHHQQQHSPFLPAPSSPSSSLSSTHQFIHQHDNYSHQHQRHQQQQQICDFQSRLKSLTLLNFQSYAQNAYNIPGTKISYLEILLQEYGQGIESLSLTLFTPALMKQLSAVIQRYCKKLVEVSIQPGDLSLMPIEYEILSVKALLKGTMRSSSLLKASGISSSSGGGYGNMSSAVGIVASISGTNNNNNNNNSDHSVPPPISTFSLSSSTSSTSFPSPPPPSSSSSSSSSSTLNLPLQHSTLQRFTYKRARFSPQIYSQLLESSSTLTHLEISSQNSELLFPNLQGLLMTCHSLISFKAMNIPLNILDLFQGHWGCEKSLVQLTIMIWFSLSVSSSFSSRTMTMTTTTTTATLAPGSISRDLSKRKLLVPVSSSSSSSSSSSGGGGDMTNKMEMVENKRIENVVFEQLSRLKKLKDLNLTFFQPGLNLSYSESLQSFPSSSSSSSSSALSSSLHGGLRLLSGLDQLEELRLRGKFFKTVGEKEQEWIRWTLPALKVLRIEVPEGEHRSSGSSGSSADDVGRTEENRNRGGGGVGDE